jgi:hypothetical protein
MADTYTEENIPYGVLADYLFSQQQEQEQEIVPFLGAGVSISARPSGEDQRDKPECAKANEIKQAAQSLGLDSRASTFFEVAAEFALLMQSLQVQAQTQTQWNQNARAAYETLRNSEYPPSASELVDYFSKKLNYRSFREVAVRVSEKLHKDADASFRPALLEILKLVANISGVPPATLSGISAYFEAASTRKDLMQDLKEIFEKKRKVTLTHQLIAQAARWHLRRDGQGRNLGKGHYLVITTNYDQLMELALEEAGLPYVVLTMDLKDFKIRPRFGGKMSAELRGAFEAANEPRFAEQFTLVQPSFSDEGSAAAPPEASLQPAAVEEGWPEPALRAGPVPSTTPLVTESQSTPALAHRLVIVHKIHGCLFEPFTVIRSNEKELVSDSVVISDNDYVTHISIGRGTIPSCVNDVMQGKKFLFLGYSLSDWNVRGVLRAIRQKRGMDDYGDFTVIKTVSDLDAKFFGQNQIRIARTPLKTFAEGVGTSLAPEGYRITA